MTLRPLTPRRVECPVRALQLSKRLLSNPERVVRNGRNVVEDSHGNEIDMGEPICRACLVGAPREVYGNWAAWDYVVHACNHLDYDHHEMTGPSGRRLTQQQIARVYDRAIALAKEARR